MTAQASPLWRSGFLFAPRFGLLHACLQRRHELVNAAGSAGQLRLLNHPSAASPALDQSQDSLPVLIAVPLWLERPAQRIDQQFGHLDLAVGEVRGKGRLDVACRDDLISE